MCCDLKCTTRVPGGASGWGAGSGEPARDHAPAKVCRLRQKARDSGPVRTGLGPWGRELGRQGMVRCRGAARRGRQRCVANAQKTRGSGLRLRGGITGMGAGEDGPGAEAAELLPDFDHDIPAVSSKRRGPFVCSNLNS